MMRLRLKELLATYNRTRVGNDRLTMKDMAKAVNIPPGSLSKLTTFNRLPVTNTAYIEGLLRYFSQLIPDFQISDLLDFEPPLTAIASTDVEVLYPGRRRVKEGSTEEDAPTISTESDNDQAPDETTSSNEPEN